MTDKQIIIDGVDVSECSEIKNFDNVLFVCEETGRKCEVSKNCLHKQLKRKEQECERLKDIIETKLEKENICDTGLNYINDEYIYVKRQLDQLKAENGKLKTHNALLQIDNERLRADLSNYNEPFEKLLYTKKQALDEIVKLLSDALNPEITETKESFDNFYKCLDIINKAKDGE